MKDSIDERNERERIGKSIIKYWNVNYVPCEFPGAVKTGEDTEDETDASCDTVSDAQEDRELYNETTGAYSGKYGRAELDGVTKGQIDKILHEKAEKLRSLIRESERKQGDGI